MKLTALQKEHSELSKKFDTVTKDRDTLMQEVAKTAPVYVIRPFLEAAQERNIKKVNEALNNLYVEEEDFDALRRSVDQFNNFDSADLSSRLEKMELFEFRKIALTLHRRNKRFSHALEVAKSNKLYPDAIATAAESQDRELVEKLLDYFVELKLEDCFSACLYACYDLLSPHVVLEKAWMNKMTEVAMPYLIQSVHEFTSKLERIERSITDAQKAAKEAAHVAGPLAHPSQLLITNSAPGGSFQPMPPPGGFTSF